MNIDSEILTILQDLENGLVCLVPRSDIGGITSHEKTVCDCQVLCLTKALRIAVGALSKYAKPRRAQIYAIEALVEMEWALANRRTRNE